MLYEKLLSFGCIALFSAASVGAENLFSGSQAVTWENTLSVEAARFADVVAGDQIVVTLAEGANDVMELKSDGTWLPGSTFNWLEGKTEIKTVVTAAAVEALKSHGLELCGPSFTVTSVDLNPDFMSVADNAVWAGFFWIDNGWNTLEIYKSAFDNQAPRRLIIGFTDEAVDSEFLINVLTKWDDDNMKIASEKVSGQKQLVIDLTALPNSFSSYFDGENTLKIQGHVESGNSFNICSVAIEPYVSGVQVVNADKSNDKVDVYNLMGVKVKSAVSADDAVAGLAKGIYVIGGRKVAVR